MELKMRRGIIPEDWTPICPACGGEAGTFYLDDNGVIAGCEDCVTATDAWEHWEDPDGYHSPICPMCGKETDTFYQDYYFDVIGCNHCVDTVDAREETERRAPDGGDTE